MRNVGLYYDNQTASLNVFINRFHSPKKTIESIPSGNYYIIVYMQSAGNIVILNSNGRKPETDKQAQ